MAAFLSTLQYRLLESISEIYFHTEKNEPLAVVAMWSLTVRLEFELDLQFNQT